MGWDQHERRVWWVGLLTALAVAYGITVAHVPFLIGHPWGSCKIAGDELGCVLSFHLLEVPIVIEEGFFAWYSLTQFRRDTARRWLYLAALSNAMKIGFFVFECNLMMASLRWEAPAWEIVLLTTVVAVLLTGLLLNTWFGLGILQTLEHEEDETPLVRLVSLTPGPDGYYHPRSEDEVQRLVREAYEKRVSVRVRGAAHSKDEAIYPDDWADVAASGHCVILLDRMRDVDIEPLEGGGALVRVEAGVHLGKDPNDPTGTSTWANSLNVQLQQRGYALPDLGGISHQTVAGFMSTGSSGGSIQHDLMRAVTRIRFIDGRGERHDVRRGDELFYAVGVSMGLYGVITKVWFEAVDSYNVEGRELTADTAAVPIDFFGDGEGPDFATYLRDTEYARLMWWPQHDLDKMVVWEAKRVAPTAAFEPKPYQELGDDARLNSLAGSFIYTVLGNLDDIDAVPKKLAAWYRHLQEEIDDTEDPNQCARRRPRGGRVQVEDVIAHVQARLESGLARAEAQAPVTEDERQRLDAIHELELHDPTENDEDVGVPTWLARILARLLRGLANGLLYLPTTQLLAWGLRWRLPYWIDEIIAIMVRDREVTFADSWLCGLPMDNQMDDELWPTDFTELWIPLSKATEVMVALRDFYRAGGDPVLALERTGLFACELYAANASEFWMSPAHGEDVLRVDLFWFHHNAGRPDESYFPQFWELLAPFGFRPHWGKYLPPASAQWRAYYRKQLPKLEAFLEKRAELDPAQIFVTDYWRAHLGIPKLDAR